MEAFTAEFNRIIFNKLVTYHKLLLRYMEMPEKGNKQ
jgi:hypothetical protein